MQKSSHSAEYHLLRAELQRIRKLAGLSQRDLADNLGVPPSWVAKVELGERRIDLVEFCWFASACGADALEAASRLIKQMQGRPTSRRGSRSK